MWCLVKLIDNEKSDMTVLSEKVKSEIDHWLTKFPSNQRRSAVVASLLCAQAENGGWLSDEIMEAIRSGKFIYDISGSAR